MSALRSLWAEGPWEHPDDPATARRRRVVVVATLLIGAAALAWSLRITPGSLWFYPATFALAAVWTAGAFASGQLHLGRSGSRSRSVAAPPTAGRPVVLGLSTGAGLALLFVVGAFAVRLIPVLADFVAEVLAYADRGSLPLLVTITVANGIAEELFFRGALYAAAARWHPLWVTTALYALTTLAAGNPMLGFAAVVLGLVTGWQRRVTGGVLAPILTHLTWSLTMLFALPLFF